ncbi:MAG: lipocalin family protein [Maritimibacter harenae]
MSLRKLLASAVVATALALPAAAEYRDESVPLTTANVDLGRYLGTWYEIARYPNNFERGCVGVTAQYARDGDKISVLNTCRKGSVDGPATSRKGEAVPVGPGKLKVDFVPWLGGLAAGDYWVLYVAPDYSLAVVGEPSGKFGWILSRTPQIRQSQLDTALSVFARNGYDTGELRLVPQ